MDKIEVRVEAEVKPTEDPMKVNRAILNIFPNAEPETIERAGRTFLRAKLKGRKALGQFRTMLKIERIRDAARVALLKGVIETGLTFYLNKQVAYVRHISFSQPRKESPLGPIKVEILCDKPRNLVDWLTKKE